MAVFQTSRKELFGKSINVNGRPYKVDAQGRVDVAVADDVQKLRRLRADWSEQGAAAPATPAASPPPATKPTPAPAAMQKRTHAELVQILWTNPPVAEQILKMAPDALASQLANRGLPLPTGDDWKGAIERSLAGKSIGAVPQHMWPVFMQGNVAAEFLAQYAAEPALDLLSGALEARVKAARKAAQAPPPPPPPPPPPAPEPAVEVLAEPEPGWAPSPEIPGIADDLEVEAPKKSKKAAKEAAKEKKKATKK